MSKTILIKEDSLQTIKEKVVDNGNIINPNDVCVNEAAPEVDEYTIGGETDSPVGGRYYHTSDENSNMVTESKNSNRAHRQTRQIIAKYMGTDENDPTVAKVESEFEAKMFDEGKRTDWMIVLEPIAYNWYLESEDINLVKKYVNYIYLKATETTPPSAYIANVKKFGSFNEVKQFLDQQKKADDDASMEAQNNMEHNLNQNYEVRGPLNFDEAKAIGKKSCPGGEICYTQDEGVWDSEEYGNYDVNKCYALLHNDWENIPAEHDGSEANNGLPAPLNQYNGYDSYGLSMIFVWIDRFGNLYKSNTRWNHNAKYAPGHGVDNAMTETDIAMLMGVPFEQVFGVKKADINSYVRKSLNSPGASLYDIFDDVFEEYDNIQAIKLGNKYNYLVHEKHPDSSDSWYLLWDKPYEEWFDYISGFLNGFAVVGLNWKYNFINQEGRIISDQWFDNATDFNNGFAVVKLNEKYNFINQEGKIISDQWFDNVDNFKDGFAVVRLNWKYNFINQEGRIISDQWFDDVNIFREGFAKVILNRKSNFINQDGRIISDQWFDYVDSFIEGFARVILNGKYNFINQEGVIISDQWFDNAGSFIEGFARVILNGKYNFINQEGVIISDQWFDNAYSFREGFAVIELNGKRYKIDTNGNLTPLYESKKNKKILVSENQLKAIKENIESEVESSEVDLSSFKKKDSLVPSIWKDEDTLNSKVRLKLLDIADDFWEFVNITWVEPKGIILTGSICNFNWSKFSDIDLHLIVDFDEIDDRDDFVRDYMDAKKNEWNNEHKSLKIMDYPVELYVQNIDEMPEAGGIYDLEENKWLRKPNKDDIKPIGLNKFSIKDRAATIMTIIDDMWDVLNSTDDMYDIRQLGKDASKLWDKVKKMRKNSLSKNGEGGAGNIVYKVMRRMGYLDKIFDLRSAIYDKLNSVTEATKQYKKLIMEYLDKDYGMPLYNYFKWAEKATDKEKAEDLINQCPYILGKYFEDISGYYDDLDELICEFDADNDLVYDEDFLNRVLDVLEKNKLLRRLLNNVYNYAYAEELPTWMTMDFIRLVKNEWCIHFTSDAYNISREGFTGGTPEIDDLAYSGAGRQKHYAGYDFAFLIHDSNVNFNGYGDEAVIFRASGVLARHYGDEEDQVIFWGPSVKEIIPIKKGEYSRDWEIEGLDGQIFKTGKPSELAGWATDNLPQYRKQILAGKSGYIPYGFSRPPYYNESVEKQITEEIVADGNAEHNPFEKRWKAERKALKDFLVNCGKIMTSKENGKQYKVYFDQSISDLIGYNYCICVQWNPIKMKPESTIYIRALDKFTNRIFHAQYDDRGKDNMRGTMDDTGYSQRFEAKRITKQMLTEANNKKRFKRQTLNVLAQGLGLDPNDPQLQSLESDFRNVYFGHLSNQEIDRVIGYEPLFAKCALDLGFPNNDYNDIEFTKYVNYLILNTKDKPNYTEIINHYKSKVNSFDDMRNVVGGEIKAGKEADAEQQANMGSSVNPNYQVLGPLTFEEAKRYGNRSGRDAGEDGRICYSQYEDTWLSQNYSNKNKNKCYMLLRNDWQDLKGFEHDGSEKNNGLGELSQYNAYDNYGLSMIMLFINPEGELHECNVRWNHGIDGVTKFAPGRGVDHALTEMDIANLMGVPFEQVFNVKKVDIIDNIKKHLANGENPSDIFDYFGGMELGVGVVELDTTHGKKWNYLTEDGNLLWDKPLKEWFDSCSEWDYENEVGRFRIGNKFNFIKSDGTLLLRGEEYPDKTNWPDYLANFKDVVNFEFPVATANFGLHWAYLGLDGKLYDYRGNLEENKTSSKLLSNKWVNESIEANKQLITESKNSNRAHRQTRQLMAQQLGKDENDPWVIQAEQNFEQKMFDEGKRTDWMIVLEPLAYSWCLQTDDVEFIKKYLKYIYLHATSLTKEKTIAIEYLRNHGVQKKNELAPEEQQELAALIKPERQKLLNFINQVRGFENFDELKSFLDKLMEEDRATAKEAQANMGSNKNQDYEVYGPLSFEEANEYGNESGRGAGISGKICYTQDEDIWLGPDYSDDNKNQCYVLLRKDWKKFDGEEHDGSEANNGLGELSEYNAYDDYGLSMIMLFINPEGELHECNVRWNHGFSDETEFGPGRDVDHALTETDIANLMGVPFANIFNVIPFKEKVNDAFEKLKNGDKSVAESIVSVFNDKLIINMLNKYFLTDKEYNVLLSTYFDNYSFLNSSQTLMRIFCGEKENVVNENCQLVWNHPIEEWFNSIQETFNNGYTLVEIDRYFNGNQFAGQSYNLINFNTGQLFLNEQNIDNWFRYVLPGAVKMDYNKAPILVQNVYGKYSFIRATDNGFEYIIDMWLDSIGYNLNKLWDDGEIVVTKCIGEYQSKCNVFTLDGTLVYKKPIEEWPDNIKLTGLSRAIAWFGHDSYWLDKMTGELLPMY